MLFTEPDSEQALRVRPSNSLGVLQLWLRVWVRLTAMGFHRPQSLISRSSVTHCAALLAAMGLRLTL